MENEDHDIRARAARLMEEGQEYSFSEVMDNTFNQVLSQPSSSQNRPSSFHQTPGFRCFKTDHLQKTVSTVNPRSIRVLLINGQTCNLTFGHPSRNGTPLDVKGTLHCSVSLNGSNFQTDCHVNGKSELLGLNWIQRDPSLRKLLRDAQPKNKTPRISKRNPTSTSRWHSTTKISLRTPIGFLNETTAARILQWTMRETATGSIRGQSRAITDSQCFQLFNVKVTHGM
jgi:hypothetical protein